MEEVSSYPAGHFKLLPLNLLDAMRAFESSTVLNEALGKELVKGFNAKKQKEVDDYAKELTKFELEHYWNC